ncbi:hypothetical protein BLX24_12820 [Arsenicibacter rosenii]|uniref:PepSY domain-containing protein n=2 Tax=Arsenicibacter rosenii TaxID=1750698 RepID=A0A1S2VLR2_9BACT|nr:hypothetical protein BLX24_12820 [Arsenicibacter rosenii]
MSHWFKPAIAREFVRPQAIDKKALIKSPEAVLSLNHIAAFRNIRVVTIGSATYYQVKGADNQLNYYDTGSGKPLVKGDEQYAESLARYFVDDARTPVRITPITGFTNEYRYVNRLLPVWKVSFDRSDDMDVYVETEQGRLANYNEWSRKSFLWLFNNFHNWDWLAAISNHTIRVGVMLLCLSIIILSMISGLVIYGFMWDRFKTARKAAGKTGLLRKNHRRIGIAVSFVTFTFAFSGACHVTRKLTSDERIKYVHQPVIRTEKLQASLLQLPVDWGKISQIGVVSLGRKAYYQLFAKPEGNESWNKKQIDNAEGSRKEAVTRQKSGITYYDTQTGTLLPDGMTRHAKELVKRFLAADANGVPCCGRIDAIQVANAGELPALQATEILTKFDREYGFINKRLPVVKLALDTPDKLTYYIEPATSRLAARITDSDRREGLSFAVLHKYFFMDWAGKNVRDIVTMISALGVLVVSLFGLVLFLKVK